MSNKKMECPRCHGYGEVMTRDRAIDSDGSEDIGNTPYPIACPRCKGEGEIDLKERERKHIQQIKRKGK